MSVKHYDIIILGAGQIAQTIMKESREKQVLVLSRTVHDDLDLPNVSWIKWIAGETPIPTGMKAGVVINCIMPTSRKIARAAIDCGIKLLETGGRYVHLSTIAVIAKPQNDMKFNSFKGDIYIRIKKDELKYLDKYKVDKLIIYPGIVIGGDTGWDQFFSKVASSRQIIVGSSLKSKAPLIHLHDLASEILRYMHLKSNPNEKFIPDIAHDELRTWEDLICIQNKVVTKGRYDYFQSRIKNKLIVILNSSLVPTFFWEQISGIMRRKKQIRNTYEAPNECDDTFVINGMTNFYVGCSYVL